MFNHDLEIDEERTERTRDAARLAAAERRRMITVSAAIEAGYRFRLQADGEAQIIAPSGQIYAVSLSAWHCTCPDFEIRGGSLRLGDRQGAACKHLLWTAQLTLCPYCGSLMIFVPHPLPIFECAACGNAKDLRLVAAERRARRQAAKAA